MSRSTVSHPARSGPARPLAGAALVVGSCLSLPIGAAFAVQLFPALGPWGVTFLRLALAALLLVLIARPRVRGWGRHQWTAVLLFGVAMAGMNGFFYAAIERIPLGPAVAIEFLGPLVLAAVLTRRLVDAVWVGVAVVGMGLLGLDGILGENALDPLGVLFVLVAAAFWAFYIRMSARVGAVIPGSGGLAIALVVATVLLIPAGVPATAAVIADPPLLLLALLTAVLSSVIPYTFELAALRRLPQRVFGVLLSLEPVFATLAGLLILGQGVTPLRVLAIALVVCASVGTTLALRRRSGPDDATTPDDAEPAVSLAITGAIPLPTAEDASDTEDPAEAGRA